MNRLLAERFKMACAEAGYPNVRVHPGTVPDEDFSWDTDSAPPHEVIWRALRLIGTHSPCLTCWLAHRTSDDCEAAGDFIQDCGLVS